MDKEDHPWESDCSQSFPRPLTLALPFVPIEGTTVNPIFLGPAPLQPQIQLHAFHKKAFLQNLCITSKLAKAIYLPLWLSGAGKQKKLLF